MKATQLLHDLGQSIWLDNITRDLLKRHAQAIHRRTVGDGADLESHDLRPRNQEQHRLRRAIREKSGEGKSGEALFFELALEDLTRAADLFRPIHDGPTAWTAGCRWRCRRCWPTTRPSTLAAAKDLHARAGRPNLFIKIPGTKEGLPAIEEAIFAGVPINVTLLFSREQYLAAAEAFLRGIERRIEAGLNPDVGSVASVFISRWDVAVMGKVPEALRNQLGIAIAKRTYKAYSELLGSPRWQRVFNAGARPQRLLWASTGTKDPKASDILYIKALAAPFTVNTMPEDFEGPRRSWRNRHDPAGRRRRLRRSAGAVRARRASMSTPWPPSFRRKGAKSFVKSWNDLMAVIDVQECRALKKASEPQVNERSHET